MGTASGRRRWERHLPQRSGQTLREESSALPVWDETVDTMLEDAAIRLLFPSPFVLILKRGVWGRPVNLQVSRGRQEAPPSSCNLQDNCVLAVVERWNFARFTGSKRGRPGNLHGICVAGPVIYKTFVCLRLWNVGISHVLRGPGAWGKQIVENLWAQSI